MVWGQLDPKKQGKWSLHFPLRADVVFNRVFTIYFPAVFSGLLRRLPFAKQFMSYSFRGRWCRCSCRHLILFVGARRHGAVVLSERLSGLVGYRLRRVGLGNSEGFMCRMHHSKHSLQSSASFRGPPHPLSRSIALQRDFQVGPGFEFCG